MASLTQFHQISLAISLNLIKDEEYNLVTLLFLCKQIHAETPLPIIITTALIKIPKRGGHINCGIFFNTFFAYKCSCSGKKERFLQILSKSKKKYSKIKVFGEVPSLCLQPWIPFNLQSIFRNSLRWFLLFTIA